MTTERTVTAARTMHARPASQLAKSASAFAAEITLGACGKSANGKSVLSLMALGLAVGDDVAIQATGADAPAALEAIAGELTTPEPSATPTTSKGG